MRACLVVFVAVLGCGYPPLPSVNLDATPVGNVCFGQIVPICVPATAVPTAFRTLDGLTEIDTDLTVSGSMCDQNNDQRGKYCVVVAAGLTLQAGATLTAHGSKPLVLLSTTTMELAGSIDVGSHQSGVPQLRGAGANPVPPAACAFRLLPVIATMGGGGAGASFGTQGGNGGDQGSPATGGGQAGGKLDTFPSALRGGCKGIDGAAIAGGPAGGGDGGGAVALIAAMQIHIGATINASGGGGHGGAIGAANGGGGGGSGGMIVLDSPVPPLFGANAKLWANGGGGGQGSSLSQDGDSGVESSGPPQPAPGGSVVGAGGDGGDGSVGPNLGGKGANGISAGGGGGGGGGGFIHAPGLTDPASISPPSSDPA